MLYCLYLRKSRADVDLESHGEVDILSRHEKTLLELAHKLNYNIGKIYREVVSGETIAARPVMQNLLQDVEQGIWAGVLVMEVERLARGDTIDQGIVAQTFKYSNTKIVTPLKIYDPNDEFDEEYFEFGLFMSRREYKTINRRLQRGRIASVKEGKYVGNKPPYGYERIRISDGKGWTLEPIEDQADVVRQIFEWYTIGERQEDGSLKRLGASLIVRRLNDMKIPSQTGNVWVVASIRDILINPTYCGKVRWNCRKTVKKMNNGQMNKSRPRADETEYIIADGLHPAIISEETFRQAQEFMKKNPPRPVNERNTVKNPLSGIVICGKCGRRMVRRPYSKSGQQPTLMCPVTSCNNISASLPVVEERILQALQNWLGEYKLQWDVDSRSKQADTPSLIEFKKKNVQNFKKGLNTLETQLSKTYDLLEQGIYDTDTFLSRSSSLSERIRQMKSDIETLEKDIDVSEARESSMKTLIPNVEKLLDVYRELPSAQAKNDILKEVLEKVVYVKNVKNTRRKQTPDEFELTIYPKIPQFSVEN